MPTKTFGEIQLHYEDRGQDKPVPVVFLHGFSVSGEVFEPQAVALSESYRIITLDERGCGQSDKPEDHYEIAWQQQDLGNFIGPEGLNLQQPVLVGHSIGAAIVMEYLIHLSQAQQHHIAKAVLVSAPVKGLGLPPGLLQQLGDGKSRMPAFATFYDGAFFNANVGTATKEWVFRISSQASWFIDQGLRDLSTKDFGPDLKKITIPVAFFHGAHDPLVDISVAREAASKIDAKLVTFDNSGHMPHLEESQRFNQELLTFLR